LNAGDRYVSKGISKLTDGEQIKPLTEEQYQKKIDDAANLAKEQGTAKGFVKAMTGK
jgi:membrane fusion protein (multidrug efflux system)